MSSFDLITLSNGTTLINRKNPSTPRTSINIFINGGNRLEHIPGISDVTTRLLIKGTKNRSAEQIAVETDSNAIDLDVEVKQDYSRLRCTFLNDDIDKAIDIIADLIQNPTFEQFDKEVSLIKGELQLELDSPKAKANDSLIRAMYPEHPYGVVSSKIMENLPNFKICDVQKNYSDTFLAENIHFISVGAFSTEQIRTKLEEKFTSVNSNNLSEKSYTIPVLEENKVIKQNKEDASQAQIIQGWYGPNLSESDYPALAVLNNILGSAGLSSRLFVELRDKKGLAYTVRSNIEVFKNSSNFTIYIGTDPKNIEIAQNGITEELGKLFKDYVKDEELDAAKKNILGKRAIYHETNSQQCFYLGFYHILGIGAEFDEIMPNMIKETTKEDVLNVANKYLNKPFITSILAPQKYL